MKITETLNIDKVQFVARKFAILTNPDRIKLIYLMLDTPGLNVTQIHKKLGLRQTDTSNHLILLRKYGILSRARHGKNSIYLINTKVLEKIIQYSEELCK